MIVPWSMPLSALFITKVPAVNQELAKIKMIPKNLVIFVPLVSAPASSVWLLLKVIATNAPKQITMPKISSLVTSSPMKKWLSIASQKGEVLEMTDNSPTGIKITAID